MCENSGWICGIFDTFVTPKRSGVLWSVSLSICFCVCVCACLSTSMSLEPLDWSVVLIPCGRGSVLLWRHCNTLYTSGFMGDVTFGCSGPSGVAWLAVLQYQAGLWCLWMPCLACFVQQWTRHVLVILLSETVSTYASQSHGSRSVTTVWI